MKRNDSKKEKTKLSESYKEFGKIVTISLIIGIIVISGFIIYNLLNPEPGFVTLGILNSEKRAENYPTNAMVGQNISFYITVENHMKRDFSFRLEILRGDHKTVLTPSGSINATSYYNTTKITLVHKQFWMSEMLNVSFSQPGPNQKIIAELWEIHSSGIEEYFNMVYLWLTIFP